MAAAACCSTRVEMSVARTENLKPALARAYSLDTIASVYASCPVEQPAHHSRALGVERWASSAGSATFERYRKCWGSRKKSVLLVVTTSQKCTSSSAAFGE